MGTKIMTKNKILAIKGFPTRGNEVIEILEMLGGKNNRLEGKDAHCFYYIQTDNNIIRLGHENYCDINNFIIFTLEEFLEKYPYKVGNMVQHKESKSCRSIYKIKKLIWKDNQIHYLVYNPWQEYDKCTITAEYLQPYKEAIYTDYAIDDNSKTDITIDGEKLIVPKGYTVKNATTNGNSLIVEYVKNKPQYPKTFEECCNMLGCKANDFFTNFNHNGCDIEISDYEDKIDDLLQNFRKLIYCRDAYWKIAGNWEPDWTDNSDKYFICYLKNELWMSNIRDCNRFLVFPTEEMRDAFFENFKDVIEACKDYL
jgi:hypothetical protein